MPRFHFHAHRGSQVIADLEGESLPDIDAAHNEALALAREMLVESLKSKDDPPDHIAVTDNDGVVVLTVPLSDLMPKAMKK
jgi:hypothetical protein